MEGMAATGEGMFLYNTLTPLGEESSEDGQGEYFCLDGSLLPLDSAGSPRGEDAVAEQATSTLTVERQEAKVSRNVYQKTGASSKGRVLQSLIDAENEFLAEASSPLGFTERPVPAGSAGLGVLSKVNAFSVSRTGIQTVGSTRVEQDVEESEFISLDVGGENIESVVQETLKFEGKRVEAPEDFNTPIKDIPPWARGRDAWIQSPFLQLHQEIVDFCEFVAPTEEEQNMRDIAVERVRAVVKTIWPSCQVKVFGSFATGLYLPTSDVDVVVLESGCQSLQDGLKALAKALTRGHVAKSIQVIGKARVPIIKFVETASDIPFDISFDVANGPEAADFIKTAMTAIPPLRPLCLVLKIFLQQRELNEVYQGGIGSYALLVMLLTHLQMHPSKRRVSNRGQDSPLETNLGILLVDFLDLYGRTLNMKDVGVSCRGGGRFFLKRDRGFNDQKRPFLLCVEDPQSPDNDIGKNSYAIQKVRSAFMMAHRLLTNLNGDIEAGLLSRIVRSDAKLVGRKLPASLPPKSQSVPAKRPHPVTFAGYYHEPKPDSGEDKYVVGDGTFSNSDSDDGRGFKTSERRRRGRWQDYEEEDFPRGESEDGYLSRKAKRAKRYKEGVNDTSQFAYNRYNDGSSTPQETGGEHSRKRHREEGSASHQSSRRKDSPKIKNSTLNVTESSGPEEGEVRLSRRARKREDFSKWKAAKIEKSERIIHEIERRGKNSSDDMNNGEETAKGAKSVISENGHNQHTHWNDDDVEINRSRSNYSRFKEMPAGRRGRDSNDQLRVEASESKRRIVITKPAHKKIKYV